MEALESAPTIELLYLQNNRISRISGLDRLKKLKKIYLTKNRIQVFEGMMENKQLEEVHIDRQHLKAGEHFVLDPRCCQALSSSLQLLNMARSHCTEIILRSGI